MVDFTDFIDNDDEEVSAAASLLAAAKQGLEEGELTREQFDELAEDALQITEMEELANDLERKIMIQKTVEIFKTIIKAIPR